MCGKKKIKKSTPPNNNHPIKTPPPQSKKKKKILTQTCVPIENNVYGNKNNVRLQRKHSVKI